MYFTPERLSEVFNHCGALDVAPGHVVDLVGVNLQSREVVSGPYQKVFLGVDHPISVHPATLIGTDSQGYVYYIGEIYGFDSHPVPTIDPTFTLVTPIRRLPGGVTCEIPLTLPPIGGIQCVRQISKLYVFPPDELASGRIWDGYKRMLAAWSQVPVPRPSGGYIAPRQNPLIRPTLP